MHFGNALKKFLAIAVFMIIAGIVIFIWLDRGERKDLPIEKILTELHPNSADTIYKSKVGLFWGRNGEEWLIEDREIFMYSDKIENSIAQVVEELIKGPEYSKENPIPKDTRLMSVFLDQRGIVYIDFSEELVKNHPGGSEGEIMTIYCLVNTLMKNFNTINAVKILIMGKEMETLKGHVDIRYPLTFRERP